MHLFRFGGLSMKVRNHRYRPSAIGSQPYVLADSRQPKAESQLRGFTLVELLVVIAIIGILVALLLPAIQAAREAARRSQCRNHLKQVAMACINHESTHKVFPRGGWGWHWMGDPDAGYNARQPGGWIYQAAPYLEEVDVTILGGDLPPAEKAKALKDQMAHAIPVFNCPSRRAGVALVARTPEGKYTELDPGGAEKPPYNAEMADKMAKTDYAINGGTGANPSTQNGGFPPGPPGPPAAQDCAPGPFPSCLGIGGPGGYFEAIEKHWNGVSTMMTGAKVGQITDGTSKTALVGEKGMLPRFYETGYGEGAHYANNNGGDNSSMYQGYDLDNTRWIGAKPRADTDHPDYTQVHYAVFGSPHSSGMHMAMCDGSVQVVDYDIDQKVWGLYGSREDGKSEFDQ
jgi:prepilin-type N-terminal cleavage/methylation domain-containing protein/prepilin-type processing-associated H-X9-DG protein